MTAPHPTTPGDDSKDVPAFPGYKVALDGGVFSCRVPKSGKLGERWKRLKPCTDKATGYLSVCLRRDGKTIRKTVHTLVLEAFDGPCPTGMEGCHRNGIRTDCRRDNLRWGTRASNQADRVEHGTSNRGERQGRSKLRETDIPEIFSVRREIPGATMEEIGILFGVAKTTIQAVLERRNWWWVEVST